MSSQTKRWQIGSIALVAAYYVAALFYNLHESERRSLQIKEIPVVGGHVGISLRVVAVNPRNSDMTARMSFRLDGSIAKDPVTPSVDLTLLLNDIHGPEEITLPSGRRIDPIETVFSLNGNENMYPLDSYEAAIRMMVTRQRRIAPAVQPTPRQEGTNDVLPAGSDDGFVVTAAPESENVPIALSIAASIPGLKFQGEKLPRTGEGIVGFNLSVRRAQNVIVVSVLLMVLMMSLAVSVMMMSVQSAWGERIELVPLSLSVSLLFGLPALRNAQPGVPPLGAFGDYLSFLWAEQIVAISAVILIWTWLTRQRRPRR